MELDAEGCASFEQLQDLIKKECDKREKNYRSLEQKYNKLQESLEQAQPKNSKQWGQGGASNKKKSSPATARRTQQRGGSLSKRQMQPQNARQPNQQKGKANDTTNVASSKKEEIQ